MSQLDVLRAQQLVAQAEIQYFDAMFGALPSKAAIVADCCKLIDEEVDSKGGISGFAIKGGYKLVKGFKPGFIPEVVESLVDAVDLGIARSEAGALRGRDAAFNAEVARAVLAGERSDLLDPVRDAVVLGAAAALVAHDAARGMRASGSAGDRIAAALPRATEAISSGATGATLDRWITVSRRLAAG